MSFKVELNSLVAVRHSRLGSDHCDCRRQGLYIPIESALGTEVSMHEVAGLESGFDLSLEASVGTLRHLISSYKESPDYVSLKDATRVSYERAFVVLRPLFDTQLNNLKRATLIRMRDRVLLPRYRTWMANYTVSVLSVVFRFGLDHGFMVENPLQERVRKLRMQRSGHPNRPWTALERRLVLDHSPPHIRLPIALAMCTGLRKADVFSIKLSAIRDGQIYVRTSKCGIPIRLPIHPILADALAARPTVDAMHIALRSDGKPWTPDGFDTVWHRLKSKLEAEGKVEKGLTIHGLRHTLGVLLKEAGAHDGEIADVLGQSTTAMARYYSQGAGLSDKMQDIVKSLDLV